MDESPPHEELEASHTVEAISRRLAKGPQHNYLKDFIYGAIDGTVTTFAVVAGVAGASLPMNVLIILAFCNLIADGFSMAVSNFLGTRAEQELRSKAEKEEKAHIALVPEGEKEEVRQIFAAKGFKGEDLEKIVQVITSDVKLWLNTMMQEEYGLPSQTASPLKAASITFFAFLVVGFFPLFSFVVKYIFPGIPLDPFVLSGWITGSAFFIVGTFKSLFVKKKWFISGLETLLVGGLAAGLAYLVGTLLQSI